MTFTNGNSIKFFYSAEGEKLRVKYTIGGTTTQNDDCGNIVYESGNQKYLLNDEGYYDLASGARHYDPAIARWTTQDPLADMYYPHSPYSYCTNNPIKYVDENGEWIANVVGAVLGGAVEYAGQVVANRISGKSWSESFTEIDIVDIGIAATEGAITAGTSIIKKAATKTAIGIASDIIKNAVDVEVTGEGLDAKMNSFDDFVLGSTIDALTVGVKVDANVKVWEPGSVNKQKKLARAKQDANGEVFNPKVEEAKAKDRIKKANEVNSTVSEYASNTLDELINKSLNGGYERNKN